MEEKGEVVKDNSLTVYFDKDIPKMIQLVAGNKLQTMDGAAYRHMNFIGQPWATKVDAFNKPGLALHAL